MQGDKPSSAPHSISSRCANASSRVSAWRLTPPWAVAPMAAMAVSRRDNLSSFTKPLAGWAGQTLMMFS
ncbi:hypothetical protein WJ968_19605 [Achromobacter xylosoxidans]